MIQGTRRRWAAAWSVGIGVALASAGPVPVSAEQTESRATPFERASEGDSLADERLLALVPAVVQALNLASYDPVLAANFFPETWIEALVVGAIQVDAEVPLELTGSDAPHAWPIGPWATAASMVETIRAADPAAVASLYGALRPRLAGQCAQLGLTLGECEQTIRRSMHRLSDSTIRQRAGGTPKLAMTPTQRELARLGEPVVVALGDQLQALGRRLFERSAKRGS